MVNFSWRLFFVLASLSYSSSEDYKESEPDYNDDEKSDKEGEEEQEQEIGEITTTNHVF